jgi:hypothetical protein
MLLKCDKLIKHINSNNMLKVKWNNIIKYEFNMSINTILPLKYKKGELLTILYVICVFV